MNAEDIICFYRETEEYGFLSNRLESPFEYAGIHFSSSIQFLSYHKVMLFGQRRVGQKILEEKDPVEMKKMSSTAGIENFRDMLWDVTGEGIAQRGIRAKFQQHPDLAEKLIQTEGKILAYCTPLDDMWGNGLNISNPECSIISSWKGKNLLGKVLMEVRKQMRVWYMLFGKPLEYVDIRNVSHIPEFDMTLGELSQDPLFWKAINTYVLSLPDTHAKEVCLWSEKLGRMDVNILSLPRAGFFEMKQEIYDISRTKQAMIEQSGKKL